MHFLITISARYRWGWRRHCTGPYFDDDDPWAVAVFYLQRHMHSSGGILGTSSVVTRCVLYPENDFYRRYMHHQKRFCPCVSSLFLWSVVCRRRMIDDYTIRLPNSIPDDDDQIHISDSPTCHNIFLYIQSQIWELCTPAAFSSRPLFDAKPIQPADGQWEKEAKQNPRAQPSSSSAWHSLLFCSSSYFLAKAAICIHHSHSRIELLLISALKGQHDLRQMMKCIHWAKYMLEEGATRYKARLAHSKRSIGVPIRICQQR